ncbi:transcription antitermination factor NusB [Syntrophorhabdus aromaticivorans]|uniref:Transcription antitermination protein NusB n=1 Tax=Syntrophorhabdus aromaticivorans TaxID=328301 RepID=A0A351U0L0_9BACT|nr:transcription antitermination factor NusB [Syntrophorhabdus aromaticivorans]NLW35238.1 transcription antitermination factor NusB [Syntrophorhabdus aromaticivorans]HBA53491.1 transcription antitermination factor NusB [Syntrophorhabdus aromaticivorans]
MLYQVETAGEDPELALARYCESFPYQKDIIDYTRFLLSGIKDNKGLIDRYIAGASEHWKMERTTYIDRNIIRVGVYEMFFSEDVPPKVAINEAIELGKKYGNEDSGDFINGVLDRVLREYYEKERNVRDEGR